MTLFSLVDVPEKIEEPPPDYRIWVAIPGTDPYDGSIMWASEDCDHHDLFPNGYSMEDNGIKVPETMKFTQGLWEFRLHPWGYLNQSPNGDDWECGLDVSESKLIIAFPAYPTEKKDGV